MDVEETGEIYNKFYHELLPNKSYVCVNEDWPWDYFYFENEECEKDFLNHYGAYIDRQ